MDGLPASTGQTLRMVRYERQRAGAPCVCQRWANQPDRLDRPDRPDWLVIRW
jgi:hypothetical protein